MVLSKDIGSYMTKFKYTELSSYWISHVPFISRAWHRVCIALRHCQSCGLTLLTYIFIYKKLLYYYVYWTVHNCDS